MQGDSPARLIARCMGAFRLDDGSASTFHIRTRKARALLAVLVLQGRSMPREAMADILWSDRGPAQARSSLRQAIFELLHSDADAGSLLIADRQQLAVRDEAVVSDLELISKTASKGEWAGLLALLESSDCGLLTNLDGLDSEFDDWLRMQRSREPARTLALVVTAIERRSAEIGPPVAIALVDEILRLDPVSEEATRLGMRLAQEAGDSAATHRYFSTLRARLRTEYDAEPAVETVEAFAALKVRRPMPGLPTKGKPEPQPEIERPARLSRSALVPLIAVLLLAGGLSGSSFPGAGQDISPTGEDPILLAVMPFERDSPEQAFLAEGLWEDTRAALARNARLRVLGRVSTDALASRTLAARDYRDGFGVDLLLEGRVRQRGDRLLVSVALTRTSDGAVIWQDSFGPRVGDPIALQEAIAASVEGKLRARLAPGGGRRADQIATSPAVYALYGEARSLLRERDPDQVRRAEALLRRAVRLDPNFAPAWSSLGYAMYLSDWAPVARSASDSKSYAAVRRALDLAPNLAEGHATLAALEHGDSQAAERSMRRAVMLDPSYAEGWNWLGNALHANYRYGEATAAFERAIEIDPLWFPPVQNLVWSANEGRDEKALQRLFRTMRRSGANAELIATLRAENLLNRGDYSGSVRALQAVKGDPEGLPGRATLHGNVDVLMILDYPDEAARLSGLPSWFGQMVRSERVPPTTLDGRALEPADFFSTIHFAPFASRSLVNLGQAARLVALYRAAFPSADAFLSRARRNDDLTYLAPTLAVALQSTGHADEARYILSVAAKYPESGLKASPTARQPAADLAPIRAAQGRREPALRLLSLALSRGWLPDGRRHPVDLAREPAFRELLADPRFRAIRKRILDHVARERAELGPLDV